MRSKIEFQRTECGVNIAKTNKHESIELKLKNKNFIEYMEEAMILYI